LIYRAEGEDRRYIHTLGAGFTGENIPPSFPADGVLLAAGYLKLSWNDQALWISFRQATATLGRRAECLHSSSGVDA
jgi:hypothetical protein